MYFCDDEDDDDDDDDDADADDDDDDDDDDGDDDDDDDDADDDDDDDDDDADDDDDDDDDDLLYFCTNLISSKRMPQGILNFCFSNFSYWHMQEQEPGWDGTPSTCQSNNMRKGPCGTAMLRVPLV